MATLVFGAVGSLVGGPLGGAIGALVGRQLDRQIIGSPSREGPRLQELKASTSSYGQPLALHAGRMRVAGTIIWSSDLVEGSETSGGSKGSARTTIYSYSTSFAVALAGHPIDAVGRIWADGNLLRGAAGDLKTGGTFRLHSGHDDQSPDPLLAGSEPGRCPAYRGCAYAVFESLDLTDFGNRLPALTFEIFAGSGEQAFARLLEPVGARADKGLTIEGMEGFSYEGGELLPALGLLGLARPIRADCEIVPLTLKPVAVPASEPARLGPAIAWEDGEFGSATGSRRARSTGAEGYAGLRYYDVARDFQPSVQHAARRAATGAVRTLDFPAAFTAQGARDTIQTLVWRGDRDRANLLYRCAEIDPAALPGAILRVPGHRGLWMVEAWEWREGGVELELRQHVSGQRIVAPSDPGSAWVPPDRPAATLSLRVFELPWDGNGASDSRRIFAAVGGGEGRWAGATLHVVRDGALVPLGVAAQRRAATGASADTLGPSPALMFEPAATLDLVLDDATQDLPTTTLQGLAAGENRVLLGEEVLQYRQAEPLGDGRWRLTGLLRGRGRTEPAAARGHDAGTLATWLEGPLVHLPADQIGIAEAEIAALDNSGAEPVIAALENPGATLVPPCPVHPLAARMADGSLQLGWTRRARGGWPWRDGVEVPLVEQQERYEIGVGPVAAPLLLQLASLGRATVAAADLAGLPPGAPVWVRQIGTHARSPALLLTHL